MDVTIRLIWKSSFGKKDPVLLECHPFFLITVFDSNLPMAITNNDIHLQEGSLTPYEYMQKEKTGQPRTWCGFTWRFRFRFIRIWFQNETDLYLAM